MRTLERVDVPVWVARVHASLGRSPDTLAAGSMLLTPLHPSSSPQFDEEEEEQEEEADDSPDAESEPCPNCGNTYK